MDRWHEVKEINDLTQRDLDDLGMTREQVHAFARMPRDVADRVKHMAAIFGLSDAELHMNHDAYLEILSTCGTCRDRTKCTHLLSLGTDASPLEADFCLNAEVFEARVAQPSA
jgi:hypothetical protein